jgi:hypothetical protein
MGMHPNKGSSLVSQALVQALLGLVLIASVGCPGPDGSRTPDVTLNPRGRILPNLIVHEDHQKGSEFWVQLEIDLAKMPEADLKRLQDLVRNPTPDGLTEAEKLVTPHWGDNGVTPRKAFKEIVHCAFLDNIEKLKEDNPTEPSCPDTW